jgi:hypothetical protein
MKNAKILRQQLRSLQANCVSAIQNIESIVSLLDEDLKSSDSSQKAEKCRHPMDWLKDMRTMGHPRRFHCTQCKQIIDVEDEKILELAVSRG